MKNPSDPATKADVSHVSSRIDGVKADVTLLKMQTREINSKIEDLGFDLRRAEVLQEEMNDHLKAILEVLGPKMEEVTAHNHTLDNHEERITTLETFKKAAA